MLNDLRFNLVLELEFEKLEFRNIRMLKENFNLPIFENKQESFI